MVACDFDPKAIWTENRKNKAPNIDFVLADIRTDMPQGTFDNIVWDAAIEHFTEEELLIFLIWKSGNTATNKGKNDELHVLQREDGTRDCSLPYRQERLPPHTG